MLVSLSLLKKYVDINIPKKELAEKLSEAGLGVESIEEKDGDFIFDLEVTPNRPDWLSVVGVAREIAAITGAKLKMPKETDIKKPKNPLPIKIEPNYLINPRFSGIILSNVKVDESPQWLKKALIQAGMRPINNVVDITNFVMYELGNPIHAFDYDKIEGHEMAVGEARDGENFESVDGIVYKLPKGAVVIRDSKKIIDLCGIKGGKNSGTYMDTKNILIRVPVEMPQLIRKTSSQLALRSDASSIFEKAVDAGGTIASLKRCVGLILEIAGGEEASDIFDYREKEFLPWKIKVKTDKINKLLGFVLPDSEIINILKKLNLEPQIKGGILEVNVPTYRNDLKIDEDIIEEVGRIYGYSHIERRLMTGEIPIQKIPYFRDYSLEEKVKYILTASGFSEIKSYSLISEQDIVSLSINPDRVLRVDNPVSRDYEYLRPTLKAGLIKGLLENSKIKEDVSLFELGKVYEKTKDEAGERYFLSGITNSLKYAKVKGVIQKIFDDFGIKDEPSNYIEILEKAIFFEINFSEIEKEAKISKAYKPIPKYPPIIEDLSVSLKTNAKIGKFIETIKKQSNLISSVELVDEFKNSKTFRIIYQSKDRNLTNEEVAEIRKKIEKEVKAWVLG